MLLIVRYLQYCNKTTTVSSNIRLTGTSISSVMITTRIPQWFLNSINGRVKLEAIVDYNKI